MNGSFNNKETRSTHQPICRFASVARGVLGGSPRRPVALPPGSGHRFLLAARCDGHRHVDRVAGRQVNPGSGRRAPRSRLNGDYSSP